jgi:hypothetical protein
MARRLLSSRKAPTAYRRNRGLPGPAFNDFLVGGLPPATGRKMHFTGTTVLKVLDGKIVEEIGLDDDVTALTQLVLLKPA